MGVLLFKLTNVPEDEADEVRQLLQQQGFDIYETDTGRWRTGIAAIWLNNPHQLDEARALLEEYQSARTARARETYEDAKRSGEIPGLGARLRDKPHMVAATLLAITIIAGLMVVPFIGFLA